MLTSPCNFPNREKYIYIYYLMKDLQTFYSNMRIIIQAEGKASNPFLMPFPGLSIYANRQGRDIKDMGMMSNKKNPRQWSSPQGRAYSQPNCSIRLGSRQGAEVPAAGTG